MHCKPDVALFNNNSDSLFSMEARDFSIVLEGK